jgi:predicted RNA-binding protein (TIGR00451 family)
MRELNSLHGCSQGHIQIVVINGEPLFFTTRDGPWCPTLRMVHKYPDMIKKLRVDTGAIKFVLAGADIMCPGLTSPGATIHDEVRLFNPVRNFSQALCYCIIEVYSSCQGVSCLAVHVV